MTYDLYIGDRSFSSWSLRGWLMFEKFGLPYRTHMMGLYSDTFDQDMRVIAPARTVPAMRDPDGVVVADTLAMAETLAETHPDAGLWPKAAATRAFARWIVAEMHSGFSPLRTDCPMQLLHQVDGFAPSQAYGRPPVILQTVLGYWGTIAWRMCFTPLLPRASQVTICPWATHQRLMLIKSYQMTHFDNGARWV